MRSCIFAYLQWKHRLRTSVCSYILFSSAVELVFTRFGRLVSWDLRTSQFCLKRPLSPSVTTQSFQCSRVRFLTSLSYFCLPSLYSHAYMQKPNMSLPSDSHLSGEGYSQGVRGVTADRSRWSQKMLIFCPFSFFSYFDSQSGFRSSL